MEGVIAILGGFFIAGFAIWTRHQRKMADLQEKLPATSDADSMRMNEEMKYLKDRVAVLEQIVTDGRGARELEQEIAKLKDS